ncbi:MAG: hypothetical protein IKR19_01330, partial [Acholeplasmatales bacterium]|nr:hypothetical protein [Acholeplasmatales bacterium]
MKSEFNDVGSEFNKSINEVNPGLEAARYPEVAPSGGELFLGKETSSDEGTQSASKQSVEDYQDLQEKINRFSNTADGTQSPDMNSVNAANEAELVAEAQAGAATSASVSVSSTVASLAGSVSVITVAGVVVAIVA